MWESVKVERDPFLDEFNLHRYHQGYIGLDGIQVEHSLALDDELVTQLVPGIVINVLHINTHIAFLSDDDELRGEAKTLGYLYLLSSRQGIQARLLRLPTPIPARSGWDGVSSKPPVPLTDSGPNIYPVSITQLRPGDRDET